MALRVIDSLKLLFAPFLPFSSQKLHETLGYEGNLFGKQIVHEYQETSRKHKGLTYELRMARRPVAAVDPPAGPGPARAATFVSQAG